MEFRNPGLRHYAEKQCRKRHIDCEWHVSIPQGWHNGQGSITQSLSAQAAASVTPGTSQKTVVAAYKWVTGNQTVLGNSNLVAGNIKKNISIFGVTGTYAVDVAVYYNQNPVWLLKGTERAPAAWIQTRYWTETGTWLGFLIFKFMWDTSMRFITRVNVRVRLNRDIVIANTINVYRSQQWEMRISADMWSTAGGNVDPQWTSGYVLHDVSPRMRAYGFSDSFCLTAYQSVLNLQEDSENYIIYWWQ